MSIVTNGTSIMQTGIGHADLQTPRTPQNQPPTRCQSIKRKSQRSPTCNKQQQKNFLTSLYFSSVIVDFGYEAYWSANVSKWISCHEWRCYLTAQSRSLEQDPDSDLEEWWMKLRNP